MFGYQQEYEPIVGSQELNKLGLYTKNLAVKVVRNLTHLNPIMLESKKNFYQKRSQDKIFQTGMVRVPDKQFRPWHDYEKYFKKIKISTYLRDHILGTSGWMMNILHVLFHLFIIGVIVVPINILSAWMMLEETQFDPDPFELGFNERDLFNADYERFWFTSLKVELQVYLIG